MRKMNEFPLASLAVALLVGLVVGFPIGWCVGTQTGVAYASIDLVCGDKTFTVTTGTKGGHCKTTPSPQGTPQIATCEDGDNTAQASCAYGGCVETAGAGDCKKKPS
jgi:hypothetical protein